MTIEEAIIILEDCELNPCVSEDREAIDMAIKALEEQQNPNSIRINFVGEEEAKEFEEYLKNQQESILDKIRAEIKTYGDVYKEFCAKFPNLEVVDYRPATETYVSQLSTGIPNAIIVWLKGGSYVIYKAESEE